MICELTIENVAVIKKLTVNFEDGFSVMTGETGAGKSIIIDSVNLLIGSKTVRGAKELIRNGEDHALVAACFSDIKKETLDLLAENEIYPDDDGSVYVQRTINLDGKIQSKVNGRSVPASVLRLVGTQLINIHGQHDNQKLLDSERHLEFLDNFAHTEDMLKAYTDKFNELVSIRKDYTNSTKSEKDLKDRIDTLNFQITEIDSARLKKDEDILLKEKRERLKNIEKIAKYSSLITNSLSGGDNSGAIGLIKNAIEGVTKLADVIPNSQNIISRLNNCLYEVEDISEITNNLYDSDVTDPEAELDEIETRLSQIERLQSKYGTTILEILEYRKNAVEELEKIKNHDKNVEILRQNMNRVAKEAFNLGAILSNARKKAAENLSKLVTDQLHYLDLEKTKFHVQVDPLYGDNGVKKLSASGIDVIEFLISTNPGEPLKPLAKVASGGELSRVMLAMKNVFADSDGVRTLIFDEIDTGVSGKTSSKIGKKLKELGKCCQVIAITHSLQIAVEANTHYKISKHEIDGKNETEIVKLTHSERIDEIARIMGGIDISDSVRATSEEMLTSAQNEE